MTEENQTLFEEYASKVTALVGEGKFDEAIEISQKFPVLHQATQKAIEEIMKKEHTQNKKKHRTSKPRKFIRQ